MLVRGLISTLSSWRAGELYYLLYSEHSLPESGSHNILWMYDKRFIWWTREREREREREEVEGRETFWHKFILFIAITVQWANDDYDDDIIKINISALNFANARSRGCFPEWNCTSHIHIKGKTLQKNASTHLTVAAFNSHYYVLPTE